MRIVQDVEAPVAAPRPGLPTWAAGLIGVVAGAVALGVAELVAGLIDPQASPIVAVGGTFVDHTPLWLKDWAIAVFGENDKLALIIGIVAVLGVIAAALGLLARRSITYGRAGMASFGVVGTVAALTRPQAGVLDAIPSLLGAAIGAWALAILLRRAAVDFPRPDPAEEAEEDEETGERPAVMIAGGTPHAVDRRALLTGAVGGLAVAGVSGVIGRSLSGGKRVDVARSAVALPSPAVPAKALPAGVDLRIKGLSSFVTPNADFYRVDTALIVPQVDPGTWTLKIHGLVDRPIELTFDQLIRRPLIEADVTLTCVSNEVGGPYIGNARWLGARLADVLREAGIKSGADMLLSTSADGWTCGTPVDVVMDGRDALLAIAMNGEALPVAHGFPARQVVPGLYGYVSATKWVTDIKVTRFDADEGYWTPRGWAAKGPIKTESRIDVPSSDRIPAGRTTIAGVAWAQHRGLSAVEVRIDGGQWTQARLANVPGPDTWRQWVIDDWNATPGKHTIQVRATDATGRTQTETPAPPAPDGASGWHSIQVEVT